MADSKSIGIDATEGLAYAAMKAYDFPEPYELSLINLSENATFLVTATDSDDRAVMRVHRLGYHDRASIESELDWTTALRLDIGVATPAVVSARDGSRVTTIRDGDVDRHVVLFDLAPGAEPDGELLRASDFRLLGRLTAKLHMHAMTWQRPPTFTRFKWDWDAFLGEEARWGRWSDGVGIGAEEIDVLGAATALLRRRLSEYGTGPDRYGLIHADLRLANLLIIDDQITVIDFDDCGESWFMYDFGTAVSFIEDDPRVPDWRAAWLTGYREVRELSAEHERMLATFVMLRRLMLVAWMGSHSHSTEAVALGKSFTAGTMVLAHRYLASDGQSIDRDVAA
ncbi:phosphotransferase enzyme family protein [Gordonia phthalatica]|uniref:Aminoglycoside phosphotransferase n=1 Tax=Gordonia phthalatica TaxID=1136941 RepID=A0A0N7FU39_9ACTN|nr:phosphotransferase [Gordonia phthalatica]ALG83287.1 aminoglycoside phosphotransferase [Gordonia phthalatica]